MNESEATADVWLTQARAAFERYSEPLLRQVMQIFLKPRNQWPPEELIDRGLSTLTNAAIIDRRLKELSPAAQKIMAILGITGQPTGRVGHLIAILATLGHAEGLTPVLELLNSGLAQPVFPAEGDAPITEFEQWLSLGAIDRARIFAHPAVTRRATETELGLPELKTRKLDVKSRPISDGLEWLLRTAAVWVHVAAAPLRLTQYGQLFKRDLQKFQTDELLASPFAEQLTPLPDPWSPAFELAQSVGIVAMRDGELRADSQPAVWAAPLSTALSDLAKGLFDLRNWDPLTGQTSSDDPGLFPSIFVPILLMLRSLPEGHWIPADSLAEPVYARHPAWSSMLKRKPEQATAWVEKLLLGIGFPLKLVDAVQESDGWFYRLGDTGRQLLMGEVARPADVELMQTLIVQPNGEMVIFRLGLTPEIIGRLTRFANWKTFGSACTMEMNAESVYRGLENALTQTDIQRLLEQHSTRALPATVIDSLQRWSSKRERITLWASATLFEFTAAEDLDSAFSRGLVSVKVTDRIGIAATGEEIDYKHFRLIGNRDYEARPQKCLSFDENGVTFSIDTAQSDLVLEAELVQIAEPLPVVPGGARRFRLTPESLKAGQQRGFNISELEQWAIDRSGDSLSAAARLIARGSSMPALCAKLLVVRFGSEAVTDGVLQYPPTAELIADRLGPDAVVIDEDRIDALTDALAAVGITMQQEASPVH